MEMIEVKRMCAKELVQYMITKEQAKQRRLSTILSVIPWDSITTQEEKDIYDFLDESIR